MSTTEFAPLVEHDNTHLHTRSGTLQAKLPFDLRASIRFLEGFAPCKGQQCMTASTLTKAITVDGQIVVFKVEATSDLDVVAYRLFSDQSISDSRQVEVAAAIDGYFSMSDDLGPFYKLAQGDHPDFAFIVNRLHGLHQVRFLTVPEIACWAILSQRTYPSVAQSMKQKIVDTYGRSLTVDGERHQAFPELTDLEAVGADDLGVLINNTRKGEYIHNVVYGISEIGVDRLASLPYAEARDALREIRGVGEWTAAAILLRGLGRMNEVPMEMDSFIRPTKEVYGDDVVMADVARYYGENIGYWAFYLHSGIGGLREQRGR